MLDGGQALADVGVVRTTLHRQGPLAHLGENDGWVEDLVDGEGALEPAQSGGSHDDGVEVGRLGQPGVDVPSQSGEGEVGPDPCQLGTTPHGSGSHTGADRQPVECRAHERVARVVALGNGGDDQPVGRFRRQVLGRVHGEVGPAVEHRRLDLLHEHALAAHLPDGDVGTPVAGGLDDDGLDRLTEGGSDQVGLQPGQRAGPSGRAEHGTKYRRARGGRRRGARRAPCRPRP